MPALSWWLLCTRICVLLSGNVTRVLCSWSSSVKISHKGLVLRQSSLSHAYFSGSPHAALVRWVICCQLGLCAFTALCRHQYKLQYRCKGMLLLQEPAHQTSSDACSCTMLLIGATQRWPGSCVVPATAADGCERSTAEGNQVILY